MEFRRVLFRSRPKTPPHGPCSKAMPAVEASALEKHRNSSVSATSAALMKRNGRSASAFPQPLHRLETVDIKEEPTITVTPRSDERRVGKGCVGPLKSGGPPIN